MSNNTEREYWLKVEGDIQSLLDRCEGHLDENIVQSVQHYLDHSEYEMAFEGLFLELMKVDCSLSKEEGRAYRELGEKLGLNEESVFDAEFWHKFIQYYP